jgi:hypothetical protein
MRLSGISAAWLLVLLPAGGFASDVLTERNNNGRTGATQVANLNASTFASGAWGRRGELAVDGRVYAQPLYVERLQIPSNGVHDVVYIATSKNKVYAFDARTLAPIWPVVKLGSNDCSHISPGPPDACDGLSPDGIGIEATPVIDRARSRMYVSYRINTSLSVNDPTGGRQMLRAIDIRTGATVGPAVEVRAAGFNPVWHRSRAGLLFLNGVVYVAYGSRDEAVDKPWRGQSPIFHGWVMAFDPDTLAMLGSFRVTDQNVDGGGIWQASTGLAADETSIYFITGNRRAAADHLDRNLETLADSFLRLIPRRTRSPLTGAAIMTFNVADFFTPYRKLWLDETDLDLGSAGPLLIPDSNYLVGGGKQGLLYVLDRHKMGGFDRAHAWTPTVWDAVHADTIASERPEDFGADHVVQKFQAAFHQYIPPESPYLAPPGAPIAAAHQLDDQLDLFVVGRDGGIYVTWERGDGPWSDGGTTGGRNPRSYPVRITTPNLAPPGAHVAAAKQTNNQLDAFVVGNDGRIWVTWVTGIGHWADGTPGNPGPAPITGPNLAPPGACLTAAKQSDNQLDVFVVGNDGAIWVTWVTGVGHWSDGTPGNASPARITPPNFAPKGACLTAAKQTADQLDVFVAGNDGGLWVTWVVGLGHWSDGTPGHPGPARITPANFAPPGAALASAAQTANQLDVFVVGNDGGVWVTWVVGIGHWTDGSPGNPGPARITPLNFAPPGTGITASGQVPGQLDVFVVDNAGAMRVTWVVGTGFWSDGAGGRPAPAFTTPPMFPKKSDLVAAKQNASQLDAFAVGWDGAIRLTFVVGTGRWTDGGEGAAAPARLSRAIWMRDWLFWPHIHGTPVFAKFPDGAATLYIWPEKDHFKSYPWTGTKFDEGGKKLAVDRTGQLTLGPDGMPGGMLSVTVDPTQRRAGIVFAASTQTDATDGPGLVSAFDAVTMRELWNNRDERPYRFSKFVPPTIAGDRLFVPTCGLIDGGAGRVLVYGR